jgi:peptide/nickel transport system permease protein
MMRTSTVDILRTDYIRTARAKGVAEGRVIRKHLMRNALGPIVTMIGMDIPWFLGNIVLVETVFGWPGMGRLAVDAIQTVDVPLIMGTVVITAYIVVISSIVTDIGHTLLDPRVRMA